jgi:SHS2 domain-containing protein
MRKIKYLEHTADIRLFVMGDSLEELFTAALEGMNGLLKRDVQTGGEKITETTKIESTDRTALLIDFLSEVLALSHSHKAVFREATFDRLDEQRLNASLVGPVVDGFDEDIKAVTYHEADVRRDDVGVYYTVIVFDI